MAYDSKLAERVRHHLVSRNDVVEKAMFGGLAFLLEGRMFCGVLGSELLARVGPDAHDAAMSRPHVRIMDFTGRPMRGYVFVGPDALLGKRALAGWIDECARFAKSLPAKPATRPKRAARSPRPSAASSRSARKAPPRARARPR